MPLWDADAVSDGLNAEPGVREQAPVKSEGKRFGLFVDAENVRLGMLGDVIEGLVREGELRVRRAFGRWPGEVSGEDAEVLLQHGVELRPCPKLTHFGKNAADIAMVVDVMDVFSRDEVDVFVLVSSDSDFTPLVHHLRRSGKEVWGYGLASAPDSLRMACGRFEEIGETTVDGGKGGDVPVGLAEPKLKAKVAEKTTAGKPASEMVLRRVMREAEEKHAGGWKAVSEIGNLLKSAGVPVKSLGKAKLSAVLEERDEYELRELGGPGGRWVRVKGSGGSDEVAVFSEEELVVLRGAMATCVGENGWVHLYELSETLRADERWDFGKHKGKLGKRLRKLAWVEVHEERQQLVRVKV